MADQLDRKSEPAKMKFTFLRGAEDWFNRENIKDHADATAKVAESLSEAMNARNLAFLLGAGCSSLKKGDKELGIPTMGPLAAEFIPDELPAEDNNILDQRDVTFLEKFFSIDVLGKEYAGNLERLTEVLHALRFLLQKGGATQDHDRKQADKLIEKLQQFVVAKCLDGEFSKADPSVLNLYKSFYRKLVYRDRSLPRPWVFTTNYDLFSEQALDGLGIVFCNGFSGVLDRSFNPASFKYALAEQLDVSSRRWTAVDNYIYLCKLHGSVNWVADPDAGIHGVREVQKPDPLLSGDIMIYPTPMKHHATLASPYTDLFREFQSQIVREQTVLITLGYSFGDEHINAIIHQALTVPTFRLVVFADPSQAPITKLSGLDDPRIWIIGGSTPEGNSVHYFDHIVNLFLPELPGERIEGSIAKVVRRLIRKGLDASKDGGSSDDR